MDEGQVNVEEGLAIGSRLQAVRKLAGVTQTELADAVGVTRSTLGRYERGHILPPTDVLMRMINYLRPSTPLQSAFKASADWILFGAEWADRESIDLEFFAFILDALEDNQEMLASTRLKDRVHMAFSLYNQARGFGPEDQRREFVQRAIRVIASKQPEAQRVVDAVGRALEQLANGGKAPGAD